MECVQEHLLNETAINFSTITYIVASIRAINQHFKVLAVAIELYITAWTHWWNFYSLPIIEYVHFSWHVFPQEKY